jgi:hypothetical protein
MPVSAARTDDATSATSVRTASNLGPRMTSPPTSTGAAASNAGQAKPWTIVLAESPGLMATGTAEWDEGRRLITRQPGGRRRMLAADKAYDVQRFVGPRRAANVTPHVAQQITPGRRSWIDARTTRHAGYAVSQRVRKTHRGNLWLVEDRRRAA